MSDRNSTTTLYDIQRLDRLIARKQRLLRYSGTKEVRELLQLQLQNFEARKQELVAQLCTHPDPDGLSPRGF
jgi:hypothetical protein